MNSLDKFFLRFFMLPKSIYSRMGVDIIKLEAILSAKLTIDNRRPQGFRQMQKRNEKKQVSNATLGTMAMALMMGLFFLFTFTLGNDMTTKLTVYFTLFIFMLCILLITDFTHVLIDVRDNFIILPKPVNDATFVTARLMHIGIHITKMVLPLALPASIAVVIVFGFASFLPFVFLILLATILSIFMINAVYILILKITSPQKFQSIINYLQIVFAIFIFAFYQLGPRMMERYAMEKVNFADKIWMRFFPPFWFANAMDNISNLSFNNIGLINIFLAVCIPLLSIFVVIKYLAPSFNRKLSMINSSAIEIKKAQKQKTQSSISFIEKLAKVITKESQEFMGFMFTWKMMSRSREFKLKVYPSFGYMVVFFGIMVFNFMNIGEGNISEVFGSEGKFIFIIVFYFGSFMLMSAVTYITVSEKFKAGWIFHVSPIEVPGKIMSGAVKAMIVQYYIPVFIAFSILGLALTGISVLPNLLLGFFNMMVVNMLMSYIFMNALPFSKSPESISKGRTFIRSLLTMSVPVMIGIVHYFVFDLIWAVLFFSLLSAIALWLIADGIKKISWAKLGVDAGMYV